MVVVDQCRLMAEVASGEAARLLHPSVEVEHRLMVAVVVAPCRHTVAAVVRVDSAAVVAVTCPPVEEVTLRLVAGATVAVAATTAVDITKSKQPNYQKPSRGAAFLLPAKKHLKLDT
jgi:hypothetical protein